MFRHVVSPPAVLLLFLSAASAFGQTISGVITDSRGAAISGASVELVSRDNTARASRMSDSAGVYRFERLVPGAYVLEAAAAGFERSAATPVALANQDQRIDFQLAVAALRTAVVVTASGTAQTTDELAKSVSTVDSSFLSSADESSLSDALRYLPGLRVEQQGGPGGLVSFKTRGLRNEDTAVLLDGFRLRDASAPQGDATGLLQDLMVADLDRIEVMRGAGSSLYGTNATGGVVNMITQAGGGRTRGSVLAEGGSLDLFRGVADIAGSFRNDALNYSAALSHVDVLSGIDGGLPDRTSTAHGRLDAVLSPATRLFGRIFAADSFSKVVSDPQPAGSLPPGGIIEAVPFVTFLPDVDDPDSTRAARLFSGALRFSAHPLESLTFSAGYQGLATRRRFGNGPAGPGIFQPSGNQSFFYDGDVHTADSRIDWRWGRHQLIDAGYEFEYEKYGNHSLMPNPADNSAVDVSQRSHALFAQDQISLFGDRLQLAASYRAQFFSLDLPQLSPAAGSPYAGVKPAAPPAAQTGDGSAAYFFRRTGTKLRAHAGRGYRAPSLYERFGTYYSSLFGYGAVGDPRLQPEHAISVDAGLDQNAWKGRARLSATYFYTQLQTVIAYSSLTADPFGRFSGYLNTRGGLARGAELSASLAATGTTRLFAAYTYTNARERVPLVENVLQTLITPPHQFALSATQRIGARFTAIFNLQLTGDYLAPLFDNSTFANRPYRFPGMRLAELGGAYRIPLAEHRALRFFAKVANVFDQSYFESGYRIPGATGRGGLQFEF
ncbi:MAG TPA: TonB-dependent receptor [Bryobacteraceae bacterium]|nr:TonB-dependent receptor [Bryobacteraceae bacterium]